MNSLNHSGTTDINQQREMSSILVGMKKSDEVAICQIPKKKKTKEDFIKMALKRIEGMLSNANFQRRKCKYQL